MSGTKKIVSARELLERLEADSEPPCGLVTPNRPVRTTSRPSISDWLKNVSPSSNSDILECASATSLPSQKSLQPVACNEGNDLSKQFASASSPKTVQEDGAISGEDETDLNIADEDDFDWIKGDLWPKLTRTPFISKEEPLILSSSPEVAVPAHIGELNRINLVVLAQEKERDV
jgi:hypothetical protein